MTSWPVNERGAGKNVAMTSSTGPAGPASRGDERSSLALVSVARRGSSGARTVRTAPATRRACGPLMRMTPIPARPGGVAIATIVSSGENTAPRLSLQLLRRDDDGLHERVADALRAGLRIFRNRKMHDAALVGIERTHLL